MDIKQQSNPKRQVQVSMNKPAMKIGKDGLDITVKSNHDGYLYLVLLGSDAKSFYILFPNGLDGDNKIEAGKPIRIPKENWAVKAAGPAGTDRLLALVTDTPRKLDGLRLEAPTAAKPFTYALNDLDGRAALIDYLTGAGKEAGSESFGAALFDVREVK